MPHNGDSVMVSAFPAYNPDLSFTDEETAMEAVIEAIKALRNRRTELGVPPSRKAHVYIKTEKKDLFAAAGMFFEKLASASAVEIADADFNGDGMVQAVTFDAVLYLPMDELVDKDAERERLTKELAATESEIARAEGKLGNPSFVDRAPAHLVDAEREKLAKFTEKAAQLRQAIERL